MSDLIERLQWRYATKQFDSAKKLPAGLIETLTKSLQLSASSFGLQPWKFLVISDEKLRAELLPHSWNQAQVVDCSHHVVFCHKTDFTEEDIDKFVQSISEQRDAPLESLAGYSEMMKGFLKQKDLEQKRAWMKQQVYIALGSFLVSCAQLDVDACPMEGITQSEYDRILGLEEKGWTTAVACPIGYRSNDDKYAQLAKVRYPLEEVVEFL